MRRAYIYARVSMSDSEGSIKGQVEACEVRPLR